MKNNSQSPFYLPQTHYSRQGQFPKNNSETTYYIVHSKEYGYYKNHIPFRE